MRRQLYRGGGITGLYPRQKYGAGSFVQDLKDKILGRARKLIPNELASVASKAAPFVAPFNPGIAALMRGVGRFDKRGSLTDALKQAGLTYAGGKIAQTYSPFRDTGGGGKGDTPWFQNIKDRTRKLMLGETKPTEKVTREMVEKELGKTLSKDLITEDLISKQAANMAKKALESSTTKGFIGRGGKFALGEAMGGGMPAVFAASTGVSLAIGKALEKVGPKLPGETDAEWKARRKAAVAPILRENYMTLNRWRSPSDAEVDRFVSQYTREYDNQGGRVGLRHGTPEMGIKSLDVGAPDITYEGNEGPQAPMKMASAVGDESDEISMELYGKPVKDLSPGELEDFQEYLDNLRNKFTGPVLPSPEDPINPFAPKPQGPALPDKMMAAKGGRIGQLYGTGPAGLPGIPRQAPDGMEFDMRENGGFQGLGAKEGKDDVKALLAKNEFVFTADAVRGAGGGDIELGAQRMYDTMKNLERRMA